MFAARQKDQARSSVSELVLALKNPRPLSESGNSTLKRRSQDSLGVLISEVPEKRSSESGSRRNSRTGTSSLQKISEVPEGGNKTRKSGLRSFMGYARFIQVKWYNCGILFLNFHAQFLFLDIFFFVSHSICTCSFLGMGHGNVEKNMLKPRDEDPLLDSDDERPESFDDELRRK